MKVCTFLFTSTPFGMCLSKLNQNKGRVSNEMVMIGYFCRAEVDWDDPTGSIFFFPWSFFASSKRKYALSLFALVTTVVVYGVFAHIVFHQLAWYLLFVYLCYLVHFVNTGVTYDLLQTDLTKTVPAPVFHDFWIVPSYIWCMLTQIFHFQMSGIGGRQGVDQIR